MRFLLDTNILIPLEDSKIVLAPSLANFIRIATEHHHNLLYHPATERDIARDTNEQRRKQTLQRINRYQRLQHPPQCPRNTATTNENDAVDNEILYALERDAVHALVTEDREIHVKARERGLGTRVYYIQTAEDWLKRLHNDSPVTLPNVDDVNWYNLDLRASIFDSLRASYGGFDRWFQGKSQEGRKAWVFKNDNGDLGALCIYAVQNDQKVTDAGLVLSGRSLKLCTFKVGEAVRGRKIGELFLKAAFRYATDNKLENIFATMKVPDHPYLIGLLTDFGFSEVGTYGKDAVFLKPHPVVPPPENIDAFDFHKRYFPHFRSSADVQKFIVPIIPEYHAILFPDFDDGKPKQFGLFGQANNAGNAIKLAYLCNAQTQRIRRGDVILVYRSRDLKAITSAGVVEEFHVLDNPDEIASVVSRRTVYSYDEIRKLARERTKVILFRLAQHYKTPVPYNWLLEKGVVSGQIRTIRQIDDDAYQRTYIYSKG